MYDYEYEGDVLLVLRLLKFLHQSSPDIAKRVIELYKELTLDEMFVMVEEIMWGIFDDVTMGSDEFDETAIVYFSHPDIDRLYELGSRCRDEYGSLSNAWRRKIQDIAEYYILGTSHSITIFLPAGSYLRPGFLQIAMSRNCLVIRWWICSCASSRNCAG